MANDLNPTEILFENGLYTKFTFDSEDCERLFYLVYPSQRIDWYCPRCKKETTFIPNVNYPNKHNSLYDKEFSNYATFSENKDISYFKGKDFNIRFSCTRHTYHDYVDFTLRIGFSDLMKIGQYPSYADLSDHKYQRYNKALSAAKFQELNKAIGLYSHGIGIGATVYLRRIFEDLIFETYKNLPEEIAEHLPMVNFKILRMEDKIDSLKMFLPSFLVEHKNLYGIMSKGIHELDEDICLSIFPTVRLGIELILDEKVLDIEKKEKIKLFKSQLSIAQTNNINDDNK